VTGSLPFVGASARQRLIVALDAPSLSEASEFAERVAPEVGMLKVGLELFVEAGRDAVRLGERLGLPVFLDLKLHDIPETVERAVARACAFGARLLTVHASGGPAMLERAVRRAEEEATGLSIVAVTVLTSLDAGDLDRIGVRATPADHAVRLARLAHGAGVRAFVCSPGEAAGLRSALGADASLITPGVRPASTTGSDDQKRVATPATAIAAGADALVVGRPIRDARDPAGAAREIVTEIESARHR
jgi:orotidine-5'-phosphate decarboxylase